MTDDEPDTPAFAAIEGQLTEIERVQLIERLSAGLRFELLEGLSVDFAARAQHARLPERDRLIISLAIGRPGSALRVAIAVHDELDGYASRGWKFERDRAAPADVRRAAMHRILTLQRGEVLAPRTIRRILRPSWPKSAGGFGQPHSTHCEAVIRKRDNVGDREESFQQKRRRDW